MSVISTNKFLEAGAHYGHQPSKWNPNMAKYIYTVKNRTHIINLKATVKKMDDAYNYVKSVSQKGGEIIFVGTRRQDKKIIKESAERVRGHYVTERWLGGTLTNLRTIRVRVKKLEEIERMENDGTFDSLTKKEILSLTKLKEKLTKFLSGIRYMRRTPRVMFVTEPEVHHIAVKEARKLGITIVGMCDTNNNPSDLDVVIPANDDSAKSVFLITTAIADAYAAGKGQPELAVGNENFILPEEEKREFKPRGKFGNKNFKPRRDYKNDYRQKPGADSSLDSRTNSKIITKPVVKDSIEKTVKPLVKAVVKPTTKPVVKSALKLKTKVEVKPTAKITAKPTAKTVVKPVVKSPIKAVSKPAVKKTVAKPTMKPAAKKTSVKKDNESPAAKSVASVKLKK